MLQKERDYVKEVKLKNDEMKAKIYSLRIQKMELDRRLLEMQSTIDSLKDEERTMEAAIEEKQNEIRMLKLQQEMGNEKESAQVVTLTERLNQKEAEIEDLKHRLQYPEKVWSVSTDDPSHSPVNFTVRKDQKSKTGADGNSNKTVTGEFGSDDRKEMISNQMDKFEDLQDQSIKEDGVSTSGEKSSDEGQGKKSTEDSGESSGRNVREENYGGNSSYAISENGGKDMDGEGLEIRGNGQMGKHENPQDEGQENLGAAKDGMKMEIRDDSGNGVESRARGKRGSVSNRKGKRWRLLAKNRRLENNGKHSRVTSTRFDEDDQSVLKGRVKKAVSRVVMGDKNRLERKAKDSSDAKVLESLNSENTGNKVIGLDPDFQVDKEHESPQKLQGERTIEAGDQKPAVRKFQDQEAIDIQQEKNRREIGMEATGDHEGSENFKTRDKRESDEAGSNAEENNEEYKEEIDEPEF